MHTGSATQALAFLGEEAFGQVDYILSGLPFSTLENSERARIMDAVARLLKDDGEFMAYQVRRTIESSLGRVFAHVTRQRRWLNMPPYYLYWCGCPKRSGLGRIAGLDLRTAIKKPLSGPASGRIEQCRYDGG